MYSRSTGLFWIGVAAFVLGAVGAILFGKNVATDHQLNPVTSHLGSSNLAALTASDTAWLWGCIVIGVLGLVLAGTLFVRSRRG
jgi:hypothetical protein